MHTTHKGTHMCPSLSMQADAIVKTCSNWKQTDYVPYEVDAFVFFKYNDILEKCISLA